MKTVKIGLLTFVTGWALAMAAEAKDKNGKSAEAHRGNHANSENSSRDEAKSKGAEARIKFVLSEDERRIIRTYVDDNSSRGRYGRKTLPPGLAKKVARGEELPPGWQKKCVPGEIMTAEVFEKCHPLPSELVVKLPAPPAGTITVSVGGQVVRLIKATREILDVFNVHPW